MAETHDQSEHLTPEEVIAYLQRSQSAETRWQIDYHLSTCSSCRRLVQLDILHNQMTLSLQAQIETAAQEEDTHLSYEEMEDYLENRADAILKEIVEGHILECALCATELRELQVFRQQLMAETTMPSELSCVMLLNTTGPVQIANGKARLTRLRPLSQSPSPWVDELVREGFVNPRHSLQQKFEQMRTATTPTRTRTHSHNPPTPLSPRSTAIRSSSPTFEWTTLPDADTYSVVIASLDKKGERVLHWQSVVESGNHLTLPADASLEPRKSYLWYVKARVGQEERPSAFAWFTLLSPSVLKMIEREERKRENSALELISLYERYGLYQEAFSQAERLLALNPEHPIAQRIYQHLSAILQMNLSSHLSSQ